MKKLMFAAAAIAASVAVADVTSANIVGYTTEEMAENGLGATAGAAFIPVSGESFDLAELSVTGVTAGKTANALEAQTLDEYGGTDRSFMWKDTENQFTHVKMFGWYEDNKTAYSSLTEDQKVKLGPGEALFCITKTAGAKLQTSGAVPQEDVYSDIAEDNGMGVVLANPTPVKVDLGDCKVSGCTPGKTANALEVQTLDEYGGTDRSFMWKDTENQFTHVKMLGWYEDNKTDYTTIPADQKVKLDPGKGVFIIKKCNLDIQFVWPKVEVGE